MFGRQPRRNCWGSVVGPSDVVLRKMREQIEILDGERGSHPNHAVRFKDLTKAIELLKIENGAISKQSLVATGTSGLFIGDMNPPFDIVSMTISTSGNNLDIMVTAEYWADFFDPPSGVLPLAPHFDNSAVSRLTHLFTDPVSAVQEGAFFVRTVGLPAGDHTIGLKVRALGLTQPGRWAVVRAQIFTREILR